METKDTELLLTDFFFDLCILNTTIIITANFFTHVPFWDTPQMAIYLLHANVSCMLSYILFSKKNLFLRDGFGVRFHRITKRTLIFMIISAVIEFMIMPTSYSRTFFFEYILFFYVGQLVFYWVMYQYMFFFRRTEGFSTNHTLIVGINDTSQYLRRLIDNNPLLGFKFMGYVNDKKKCHLEVLGTPDELSDLIDKYQIHMVFVTLSLYDESFRGKEYLRICNKKGIRVRFIPENQRLYKSNMEMESLGNLSMINPQEIPLDNINARIFKRMFDIVFSSIVIVCVLSWLFPILALLIKMTSKGPIFFVQKRTCMNNKTFNCYKFRSMTVNDLADTKQATTHDIRITRLGNIMRKTNIDELPQFFNVLLGHMSISGPRPHMLKHTYQYSELIDFYQIRHHVKPGITGWAQVNGYRGETDELWKMQRRVEYDIEYIENWNFWWDLKIIVLTVTSMKSLLIPPVSATNRQRMRMYGEDSSWQLRNLQH